MFDVTVLLGGSVRATAEAETPEAAALAARTLIREDADALGYPRLRDYRATFAHDGRVIAVADYETCRS